ncbi:GlxA family transcriptional regulator [Streptomonospora sp. PA3]|uniref:GlxA family transcriptional regulator n=1 Tax=Streptomonospora sp. PA3 TaxID=2607326 RepID=UPI0012DC3915|nr:GlxA family transcriptional regulator [Streptomonospora sp. PA3]MUL41711.1 GlxA family transcriptional regulator [Streptomonospora sp. PA3]
MTAPTLLIPLFPQVQSLDVTGPLEVFTGANAYCASRGRLPLYDIRTASPGGAPVRTSSGLLLTPDAALEAVPVPEMVLVPGGEGTRSPQPEVVAWLAACAPSARRVMSVCTGAFLLAEAGLLSGRRATTHWARCAALAERFPDVDVAAEPVYVRDGKFISSAGVTAGIDLALAVVEEDAGREAALIIARHLVVFLRRPGDQAQFSNQLAAQAARREPLREIQQWIVENPAADLSVEALAERAGFSPRQFARAFTTEVGMPPGRYVARTRLEAARRLLEDTGAGIEETARSCGFGTPEAMRRAFLRALGVGPSEYRRRFRPRQPAATG